jgi:hypothetical protein
MKDSYAKDFEVGCAWLLQLLGFASFLLSSMSRLNKEPDILAQAPNGNVILVEGTIEVPDDDKLTKLISRATRLEHLIEPHRSN